MGLCLCLCPKSGGCGGMDELTTYSESLFLHLKKSHSYPLSIEKLQIH